MQTILLLTDFSEASERALEFAIEIAKYSDSEIIVTNTFYIPRTDLSLPAGTMQMIYEEGKEDSKIKMSTICKQIKSTTSAIEEIGSYYYHSSCAYK
jgi:hypothetical protein